MRATKAMTKGLLAVKKARNKSVMEHLKASCVGESSGLLLNVDPCAAQCNSSLTKVRKALNPEPDPLVQGLQVAHILGAQGLQVFQPTPERRFP